MRRTLLVRASAATLALAGAWITYTQTQPSPPLGLRKLNDDLYVFGVTKGVGAGNVAIYLTDEGVILVDDMFDRNHDEIISAVKSLTDKPIKYVLNSHQHDDHAGGNARMLGINAEVISHRNARASMVLLKQPGLARITFSGQMEVHLGGKEVQAFHFGRGHTGGDAVLYFPAHRLIHTGDLFLTFPTQPFIDYANGGSALEWTKTLDEMLKLDFDVAIPGHGPVSDRAGVLKWRASFEAMRERIRGMVHAGKSKGEISKVLAGDYHWAAGGLAIQQVDAMIAELRQ
ncbi:MAG TPA: MBL fold metallo-hydrolase [Bryobacteraceae bacterium]|nr:MBL fold metallo-hydrolase [Bryobacteraceae bacterium]